MRGKSQEQIIEERKRVIDGFVDFLGRDFAFIESYQPRLSSVKPLEGLSESLGMLSTADILLAPLRTYQALMSQPFNDLYVFRTFRGVEAEITLANSYGLPIIFYDLKEDGSAAFFFNKKN